MAKTKIFKDYFEFLQREDKSLNGVNPEFAEANPNFEDDNETNEACWNCSRCSDCSRCSGCSGCSGCSRCSDCSRCSGCSGCSRCSDCSDCSRCSGCSRLKCKIELENVRAENAMLNIPKIEDIHQKVLQAVIAENHVLDMSSWHVCETTHCRAGWVVTLAGPAGKALEDQTGTEFAAMMIYKESSDIRVYPTRFYEDNETAMTDIKRCAEMESIKTKSN